MMESENQYPIVKITWVDPQMLSLGGLSYEEDLENTKLQNCVIVGHLVKETNDCYFVAKEVWDCGAFKYIHMIPKKIVEEFETLKYRGKL